MRLALVAVPGSADEPAWSSGEIPVEHAIRGFHSASLLVAMAAPPGRSWPTSSVSPRSPAKVW